MSATLLTVENLVKHFRTGRFGPTVHAVNGISFSVKAGETVLVRAGPARPRWCG
jgi:ABC-type oligopeptide transport system ATPase subunit